jgi:hypothetical protein
MTDQLSGYERKCLREMLNANVEIVEGPIEGSACWLWTGGTSTGGYGRVMVQGTHWGTHRASLPHPQGTDTQRHAHLPSL